MASKGSVINQLMDVHNRPNPLEAQTLEREAAAAHEERERLGEKDTQFLFPCMISISFFFYVYDL